MLKANRSAIVPDFVHPDLKAFSLHKDITASELVNSVENLIETLRNFRKRQNSVEAQHALIYVCNNGLDGNSIIGNYLVPMLVHCGNVKEAERVFLKLPHCNEYSWTSLIEGYIQNGEPSYAFDVFDKMQQNSVHPSRHCLITVLQLCAKRKSRERGQKLHSQIVQECYESDLIIGSILVDMYVTCGLLLEAQDVFDELPVRDVITWTALIAGHAEHGHVEEALKCLNRMQIDGLYPDAGAFVCCLKACGSLETINKGQEIHTEIAKDGFEDDLIVCNSLVGMYMKMGMVEEAETVFLEMGVKDVVSWTTLISGYVEHGYIEEALSCFKKMQEEEEMLLNDVTFICILSVCDKPEMVNEGRAIHDVIIKRGFDADPFLTSALVDMYAGSKLLAEAQDVLLSHGINDVVSWNALLNGYCVNELVHDALEAFDKMQMVGVTPDDVTFVCILKAYCRDGAINGVQGLHIDITKMGYESDPCVGNALVDSYVKCGSQAEAQDVLDHLPQRDVISWTSLMTGYAFQGNMDAVLYSIERMEEHRTQADGIVLLGLLTGCNHAGLVGKGHFESISESRELAPSISHINTFIDLLGRTGQLNEAMAMIEKMPFQPDLVTWLSMLGSCRKWQNVKLAETIFEYAMQMDNKHDASFFLMCNIYLDSCMLEDAKRIEMMKLKSIAAFKPVYTLI